MKVELRSAAFEAEHCEKPKHGLEKMELNQHIERVLAELNEAEQAEMKRKGYTFDPNQWHIKERKKFIAIDCGTSGVFLLEKATGELFNIKAYGQPDHNKKKKADIGNIQTVDGKWLHSKRYNYLR